MSTLSAVLVKEFEAQQHPVYYVSTRLNDAETRYSLIEKLVLSLVLACTKLKHYFEDHLISVQTNYPIKAILRKQDLSGRMSKWAIILSTYKIEYVPRTAIKSQALANFVADFSPDLEEKATYEVNLLTEQTRSGTWTIYTDGASNARGIGLGLVLKSPQGNNIVHTVSCEFSSTNNEAEYEALIAGLELCLDMGARHVHAKVDSQLIVNQINGSFFAKDSRRVA